MVMVSLMRDNLLVAPGATASIPCDIIGDGTALGVDVLVDPAALLARDVDPLPRFLAGESC